MQHDELDPIYLTRRRLLLLATTLGAGAPFAAALAGCGSGSGTAPFHGGGAPSLTGGTRFTDPQTLTTARARVTWELPAGFRTPAAAPMQVLTALGAFPARADGSGADTGVFSEGDTLTTLTLADGTPVLAGFVGSANGTLTARTTAEVLLYLALAGSLHTAPDVRAAFFDALDAAPALTTLAGAISDALAADAAALGRGSGGPLAGALESAAAGTRSRSVPTTRALLIDPSSAKSGAQIVQGDGINTIKAINTYRLRRLAFVDRVSYVPSGGGADIPSPAAFTKFDISATQKLTGAFSGISDGVIAIFGYGNSPWAPIQTDPVTLPLFPADAQKTTYKVKVVGPAGIYTPEDEHLLSASELEDYRFLTVKALWLDFVLPFLLGVLLPAKSLKGATNYKGEFTDAFNAFWKQYGGDVVKTLGSTVPGVLDKLYAGKMVDAFEDVLVALAGSDTARRAIIDLTLRFLAFAVTIAEGGAATGLGQAVQAAVASRVVTALLKTVGLLNAVLATADTVLQSSSWAQSRWLETWDVTALPAKISLSPATAKVHAGEAATFQAIVTDGSAPAGKPFTYHWESTRNAGAITEGLHEGASFDSSSDTVAYTSRTDAPAGATDTITVTVFLGGINDPKRLQLGRASATVSVTTEETAVVKFEDYGPPHFVNPNDHLVGGFFAIPIDPDASSYTVTVTDASGNQSGVYRIPQSSLGAPLPADAVLVSAIPAIIYPITIVSGNRFARFLHRDTFIFLPAGVQGYGGANDTLKDPASAEASIQANIDAQKLRVTYSIAR